MPDQEDSLPAAVPPTTQPPVTRPPAAGAPAAGRAPGAPMPDLPARPDLPAIEHEMLARWRHEATFEASLKQTEGAPRWTFYEGPPTANGMPGVHHVEARVFKDLFPRFKTMQGFHVVRKAGWDCHGLPVEVAVEKELGLSGKRDIEAYGVAEFNARCRESVLRHVDAFSALTTRMGYWIDLSTAYRTMDPAYVESVWWALKTIYDKGLLVRDFRISPYCPRCGTPLSDHEMGQPDVYREVTDPSVTVRLRVTSVPGDAGTALPGASLLLGADLLVWTTTPWTLVSNTAVAVHPDVRYVIARRVGSSPGGARTGTVAQQPGPPDTDPAPQAPSRAQPGEGATGEGLPRARGGHSPGEDTVVVAEALWPRVLGDGWHVLATLPGSALTGASYAPAFGIVDVPGAHRVVSGTFVTTDDGTGLVHLAPAFGADDLAVIRAHEMPVVNPVRADGRFADELPLVGGLFFKDADGPLTADLAERGLLFRSAPHAHSYPHCWRCGTALLYYALPSWYIKTTAVKEQLLEQNARTNWQPPTIKDGRYGQWLRNNVDWALSRTRYWGTPLPLWQCPQEHVTCVGSLAELSSLAGRDLSGLDPHRPFVDDVAFPCPSCGLTAARVPEVIDVWFDSGSMPFAQWGAPLRNLEQLRAGYPAQFICEAIDQTRGWFYSLMAVGTLVFGRSPYENVVCLGLVTDSQGRKMSKHVGNVIEPLGLLDSHGADAVRWFFAASGSPWGQRRIGPGVLEEIVRKVLLTYWNTASFLVLYANAAGAGQGPAAGTAWTPEAAASAPAPASRPLLDRWLLSEVHACTRDVTASLEAFDTAAAGRRLAGLIEDLSNWYVRRSRRRFWDGPGSPDGLAAFATLHSALVTVTLMLAPFTPFLADYLWKVLRPADGPQSVHLASWPAADPSLVSAELSASMALARRLVELGRSARSAASVRTRQPLSRALVGAPGFASLPAELRDLVASELNVHALDSLEAAGGELVSYTVKPEFRALGRRFGSSTQAVAAAIRAADPSFLARAVGVAGGSVTVQVPSVGPVTLTAADLVVTQTPLAGWGVASADGETVALDLALSRELRLEGHAREAVRLIQEARKSSGLSVSDRIVVRWAATDPEVAAALSGHGAAIAGEVLAVSFSPGPGSQDGPGTGRASGDAGVTGHWHEHADADLGLRLWLAVATA
jgi:isoleucyl-tRNA synthetase